MKVRREAWAPDQQRITPQRSAAQRPGHETLASVAESSPYADV
jgi:hypothetical protein